jgi:transcriptional regulator with XRE-family HTH domain
MDVHEAIARRMKIARERGGLSQREVGEAINMSGVNYGDMERGRVQINIEHLFKLAPVLGVSVAFLLGLDTGLSPEEDQLVALYRATSPGARILYRLPNSGGRSMVLAPLGALLIDLPIIWRQQKAPSPPHS